jgi:Cu(I)/Ag(I) efflux system membrane fusion protein
MKLTIYAFIAASIGALALSACGEREAASKDEVVAAAPAEAAAPAMKEEAPMSEGMEMSKEGAQTMQEHSASGEVTAVDVSAGTVTISHGAVASAGWPAMTMPFKLDAERAAELKPKDHVQFKFTLGAGGEATISTIEPMAGM